MNIQATVAVIMGSQSDWNVMKPAVEILQEFGIDVKATIVSAHRTPDRLVVFAKSAQKNGIRVIIAGAGGAAHLPGMVASMTSVPVIGVPVQATPLLGLDALLSIVQMPAGVPVATVAVNNAKNAGLLAVQMLGISDATYWDKLNQYRDTVQQHVLDQADTLV